MYSYHLLVSYSGREGRVWRQELAFDSLGSHCRDLSHTSHGRSLYSRLRPMGLRHHTDYTARMKCWPGAATSTITDNTPPPCLAFLYSRQLSINISQPRLVSFIDGNHASDMSDHRSAPLTQVPPPSRGAIIIDSHRRHEASKRQYGCGRACCSSSGPVVSATFRLSASAISFGQKHCDRQAGTLLTNYMTTATKGQYAGLLCSLLPCY